MYICFVKSCQFSLVFRFILCFILLFIVKVSEKDSEHNIITFNTSITRCKPFSELKTDQLKDLKKWKQRTKSSLLLYFTCCLSHNLSPKDRIYLTLTLNEVWVYKIRQYKISLLWSLFQEKSTAVNSQLYLTPDPSEWDKTCMPFTDTGCICYNCKFFCCLIP